MDQCIINWLLQRCPIGETTKAPVKWNNRENSSSVNANMNNILRLQFEQFELVNEMTQEKLTLRKDGEIYWLLKRCPIVGETATVQQKKKDENSDNLNEVVFHLYMIVLGRCLRQIKATKRCSRLPGPVISRTTETMLTREFRIVMPLTTEEYQIAQMFLMDEQSRQLDEIVGDKEVRVQVVRDNEPFEGQNLCNGRFTSGHFSHKIYHFNSKTLPSLLRRLLPKGLMTVHEQTWNAFPYRKTDLTNPDFMKDNFLIRMETMLLSDRGTAKNAFGLTKDALNECKKMVRIDIANDTEFLNADDIHEDFRPSTFRSVCTGRGPLTEQWQTNCEPFMCAYKMVTVKFKWLGFQTVVESFMQKQFPRLFCQFNRDLFCSMDRWYALTLTPIRLIEDEAQQALDETDELATDDGSSQEMNASNGTER
ncbi:hypothetical protein niasHT_018390 [Heterodera trifolii]|uniref:Phosphatidylinositol transfer protein N-terminal domain-containing protein n=1 Tax=Heterodera trifolii TaxID=157864 RepID=A0ABD2LDG9_9BILA